MNKSYRVTIIVLSIVWFFATYLILIRNEFSSDRFSGLEFFYNEDAPIFFCKNTEEGRLVISKAKQVKGCKYSSVSDMVSTYDHPIDILKTSVYVNKDGIEKELTYDEKTTLFYSLSKGSSSINLILSPDCSEIDLTDFSSSEDKFVLFDGEYYGTIVINSNVSVPANWTNIKTAMRINLFDWKSMCLSITIDAILVFLAWRIGVKKRTMGIVYCVSVTVIVLGTWAMISYISSTFPFISRTTVRLW